MVGDYFDQDSDILVYTDRASDLITWLQSKTMVLGLLRQYQEQNGLRTRTILRAVITRWTAHLRAYEQLLEVRPQLRGLVSAEESRPTASKLIVTGDRKAKKKAEEMCDLINNNLFWHSLAR